MEALKNPIVAGLVGAIVTGVVMYFHNMYISNHHPDYVMHDVFIVKYSVYAGLLCGLLGYVITMKPSAPQPVYNMPAQTFNPRRW